METKKEKYYGLKTQRITIESASLLDASRVKLKARKSNTEWKTSNEDLGTMNFDFDYDPSSPSRQNSSWETGF